MVNDISRRSEIAKESIHSIEMENGTISSWMRGQIKGWISGRIDDDELERMILVHYGLEPRNG